MDGQDTQDHPVNPVYPCSFLMRGRLKRDLRCLEFHAMRRRPDRLGQRMLRASRSDVRGNLAAVAESWPHRGDREV